MKLAELFPKETFPLRAQATWTSPEKDQGMILTAFYQTPLPVQLQVGFHCQLFVLRSSGEKEIVFELIIKDSTIFDQDEYDDEEDGRLFQDEYHDDQVQLFIGENGEFAEVTEEELDKRLQESVEKINLDLDFDPLMILDDLEGPSCSWQMVP